MRRRKLLLPLLYSRNIERQSFKTMASTEAESQALPTTTKVRILKAIRTVHGEQKRLEVLRMVGEVLCEEAKTTPAPPTALTFEDALKSVAVYVPTDELAAPLPQAVRAAFSGVLMSLEERPEIQATSTPTAPLRACFADMSEAYEALRKDAVTRAIDEFGLTKHVRYNKDRIYGAFYTGVKKLLGTCFKTGAGKSLNYQMCVVATPGQGKTDTLLCIRHDRELRQELIKKINECQQHVTCLHVVPLFATFNAGSSYDEDDESDFIQAALCHRLLLDYVGNDSNAFKFDSRITPRFANLKLRDVLTFVQAKESGLRGCAPSQICVIFLVDEVMKVGSKMRKLCNAFTFTQCSAMPCGQLCFSVVTCLQVDSIYDAITAGFGCPLHSIPLLPCSAEDTNNFLNELFLKCTTLVVQDKQIIHWLAHACNGHFRSLAQLWSSVVEQGQPPPEGPISSVSSACILEIIANHLAAPKFEGWVKESTEVGALFSASRKASTIHDIVFSGEGVRYRDVWPGNVTRMQRPVVLPCVSPLLLTRRIPCDEDTAVAQNIVKILPQIFQRLHMPNELPVKTWEIAIPLLEAVAATMIREANEGEPVALKDVMKGVVVQHWKTRQIELQYTSTCETCYTSWVEPSDEVKTSVLEDDEALKVACASKSATLCTANTATYPGLEGVHTMLEATSAQGVPIPVVFQMKTWKVVEWNNVEKWIAEGHKRAQEILELKEGEYFVALYITQSAQQDWKHKIPEGTIVIDQPVLELLLSPFGTSTLLQLVQQKGKDPTSIKKSE